MFSKKLKISEIELPTNKGISIIVPHYFESYKSVLIRNFNHFSHTQAEEYKTTFIAKWGNLTLSLLNSSEFSAIYTVKYNSKFKQHLNTSDKLISESLYPK